MILHPTKEKTDVHLDIFLITELSCVKVLFVFHFDIFTQKIWCNYANFQLCKLTVLEMIIVSENTSLYVVCLMNHVYALILRLSTFA